MVELITQVSGCREHKNMSKVPISDESLPDFQRVSLVVQCPSSLIEKSEKLISIFHSARAGTSKPCFIQIVENDEDFFKGCFVSLQLPKTDEDTLKVDHVEEETFLVGHAREHMHYFCRPFWYDYRCCYIKYSNHCVAYWYCNSSKVS